MDSELSFAYADKHYRIPSSSNAERSKTFRMSDCKPFMIRREFLFCNLSVAEPCAGVRSNALSVSANVRPSYRERFWLGQRGFSGLDVREKLFVSKKVPYRLSAPSPRLRGYGASPTRFQVENQIVPRCKLSSHRSACRVSVNEARLHEFQKHSRRASRLPLELQTRRSNLKSENRNEPI